VSKNKKTKTIRNWGISREFDMVLSRGVESLVVGLRVGKKILFWMIGKKLDNFF
jgi:hypothetical protein